MINLWLPLMKRACLIAALLPFQMSPGQTDGDGWTDFVPVVSNGTRNSTDPGSRIFYIDVAAGSNATGQYYWWNGSQVIDSSGNTYGSDPMNPTGAIKPFATHLPARYRGNALYNQTHYADWGLFKRGQQHAFDNSSAPQAGRSPAEPALLGAYGDLSLPRPRLMGQFRICNCGDAEVTNIVVLSVQLGTASVGGVSLHMDVPAPPYYNGDREDSRSWFWFEDVLIDNTPYGFSLQGVLDVTIYRSIVTNVWSSGGHNQAIYQDGSEVSITVEDSILYRNGMKSDPLTDSTPGRDVFSRNMYLGGGEHLGSHLINVISADGGSGGPQVRYGGIVEGSLIIEGYWFTSTDSNGNVPKWLETGMETYAFRNNVQLVYQQPTPGESSEGVTSSAQPGAGMSILMASTGTFEDNIISGVLLDELGFTSAANTSGVELNLASSTNTNGTHYSSGNIIQDNIMYRVAGLYVNGSTAIMANSGPQKFINNHWYDRGANNVLGSNGNVTSFSNLLQVDGNTFYADRSSIVNGGTLSSWKNAVMGTNQLLARNQAPWSEPTRSLKTYAQNVLGLTVASRGGLTEFFAVATAMRKGQWNSAYTAEAVVDYIRGGFDLPPLGTGETSISVTGVSLDSTTLSLDINDTAQLTATISPVDATNQSIFWSSNAQGVATVNSSGLVTAVGAGNATITVTTADGSHTATSAVTVIDNSPILVTSVSLNSTTLDLDINDTAQLTATITPSDATNQSISWSSDDMNVVTVDISGLVTAVGAGSATITVTTVDGSHTASCDVTVLDDSDDTLWRGEYLIEDEYFAETYELLGLVYIPFDPWIWSYDAMMWFYLPEGDLDDLGGAWLWPVNK